MIFDWDSLKAEENLEKHGVSFTEAASAFGDPLAATVEDIEHSTTEEAREKMIGRSGRGRLLQIVFCERHGRVRIISARVTTRKERINYEER
jgi:uncharacterized DUF497 family protein